MMPRLSNNYQISTLCCNTPYAICSQRQSDLAAKEASPYWCRVANNNHDCLLDEDWSKTVALSHASGVAAKFPEKVHHMLDEISQRGDESIVSWLPHGRAFRVHNKQRFVETVLPKFFGHSNYTSFTRQLNLYCFHRIKAGRDKGAYYHELFLHSEPYRCREIVRQRVKGNWGKKPAYNESDFYEISPSEIQINGRYKHHKDKTPKSDTKEKIDSKREIPEKIDVPSMSSTLQARSTTQNDIAWMDSFPLLCGVPYCQEPTGSFVASLLEAKCSDQTESRNFEDVSFCSDNCFSEESQTMFCMEDMEDLDEFENYQKENDVTSTKFEF